MMTKAIHYKTQTEMMMTPLKAGLIGVLGSLGALVIDGTALVPLGAACMCVFERKEIV